MSRTLSAINLRLLTITILLAVCIGCAASFIFETIIEQYGIWSIFIAILGVLGGIFGICLFYSALIGRIWALTTFLALNLFLIDSNFRTRELDDVSMDWQTLMKFAVWFGSCMIGLVHLKRSGKLLFQSFASLAVMMYGVLALASTIYSVSPMYTFGAAFGFVSLTLFSASIVHLLNSKQIILTITVSFLAFLLFSWIAFWFIPDLGRTPFWTPNGFIDRMNGIAGQPNNLGRLCSLAIGLLCLSAVKRYMHWKMALVPLIVSVITLLYTQSRTSLIAIVLALCLLYVRRKIRWSPFFAVLLGVAVVIFMNVVDFDYLAAKVTRTGNVNELYTFTERTGIWNYVLGLIAESPWLGYGYSSSKWLISTGYASKYGWTTVSAHNMILQSLLSVGILGTFFFVVRFVKQGVEFVSAPSYFRDFIFIFVLINGLMESAVIGLVPGVMTLLWLISAYWREND